MANICKWHANSRWQMINLLGARFSCSFNTSWWGSEKHLLGCDFLNWITATGLLQIRALIHFFLIDQYLTFAWEIPFDRKTDSWWLALQPAGHTLCPWPVGESLCWVWVHSGALHPPEGPCYSGGVQGLNGESKARCAACTIFVKPLCT